MSPQSHAATLPLMGAEKHSAGVVARFLVIALTAFLTVVDLFATQAILPSLTRAYGVSPAAMGSAVNASTLGMAIAGLVVAVFNKKIDQRLGILLSLVVLAVPTALLAGAPNLAVFTALRIVQGLCMATAFTLTLAYLGEHPSAVDAATASAAYITGNVASNFVGRFVSAAVTDHFGLASNFYFFAALNLVGAALVYFTVERAPPAHCFGRTMETQRASWALHLRNPRLRAAFGIGFCILFAFIGTFTYVNFVLVRPPFMAGPMELGFIYFVFLPSVITTPLVGRVVGRIGAAPAFWGSLGLAGVGLLPLLTPSLPAVLCGLVLVGIGTFFAQATATGYVSRTATSDRGSASGIYLSSYFLGGMAGSAVLGVIFDRFGWTACVAGIGASLAAAAWLAGRLSDNETTAGVRAA
jgi:MFS transporter, YNFM family, putative membrane transport protein